MSEEHVLLVLPDLSVAAMIQNAALQPAGYEVTTAANTEAAESILGEFQLPDLIILSDEINGVDGFRYARQLIKRHPLLPVIMLPREHREELLVETLRSGITGYLIPPFHPQEVLEEVDRSLAQNRLRKDWARGEAKHNTKSLEKRVNGLEMLQEIGRQITSHLDLDRVLTSVVDAAVDLTGAEEGSLLLLDERTGELYMRAARNFQDDFVRTFRLPVQDSLAGEVLRSGKPVLIDEEKPRKIKTAYLVHTLMYVPMRLQQRVIGVLEVGNRQTQKPFSDDHLSMVSALADYAAIAVENARLYSRTEIERSKLETLLEKIEEGVIVIDHEGRLMMINRVAMEAFGVSNSLVGKPVLEIFQHPDLLEIFSEDDHQSTLRREINLEDGRFFNAQFTSIPEVGLAVTMHDITHLKELDRIKTDFVNTVSHDLRSPLTAILGYVELIERVGKVNDQQREFIRRVQISVHSITALINDLLDLGRIEAGFDARNEIVPLDAIIHFAIDGLKMRIEEKQHRLRVNIEPHLPEVIGNPVRLRQMISNLLSNSIKYTQDGGEITIQALAEGGQVIIQVCDNGPGIPSSEQPYIFDRFYRGRNISYDIPGTGLGLAIVKSIVENHQGRIWVESNPGQRTTFTVVLQKADREF